VEAVTTNPIGGEEFVHALMQNCDPAIALDWITNDLREQLEDKLVINQDLFPSLPPQLSWQERIDEWLIPQSYRELDIAGHLLTLSRDENDLARVQWELKEFEKRKLLPVLQTIKYLVDVMRTHKIVWGVGRGSSVSSLVLFLLGVHRIDPIKWNLDAGEFFK
jgi:DNA polymerase III alpha subunit